jgi:hypothetical protein
LENIAQQHNNNRKNRTMPKKPPYLQKKALPPRLWKDEVEDDER